MSLTPPPAPTYDDRQLRAALGDDYRPPPMDVHYLARFASALRAT